MARDYGSRRATRQKKSSSHQFLVITVTFLLGYLTASIFDVQSLTHFMNTQVLAAHEEKPAKPLAKNPALPPKPKFEFYTLLANEKAGNSQAQAQVTKPQNTVVSSNPVNNQSATQVVVAKAIPAAAAKIHPNLRAPEAVKVVESKPLQPVHTNQGAFLVQVAAFKARPDAEHLKVSLTLKGYDVKVVPVTLPQGTWFRVVVGPYSNRTLAQKAQGTLASTARLKGVITLVRG